MAGQAGNGQWASAAVAGVALAALSLGFAAEEETRTFQGTWQNRRYKTSGPLRCKATSKDGKTWTGRFEGTFKGEKFGYDATFTATKKGAGSDLAGRATVDGDAYEWTGQMTKAALNGRFRSGKGHFGEFQLKEAAAKQKR